MAERQRGVHAVVWRSGEAPRDLVAALAQQGITWEEAGGPFDALARVLAARRESQRARVLLLVEPQALDGAEEIRRAIDRFDPGAGCWSYESGRTPRLSPLAPPARPVEPEIVVKPRPADRQALRLTGEVAEPVARPAPTPEEEPRSPGSVLTPEELAMLLADDPD